MGRVIAMLLLLISLFASDVARCAPGPDQQGRGAVVVSIECVGGRSGTDPWESPPGSTATTTEIERCIHGLLVWTKPAVAFVDASSPSGYVFKVPVDCVSGGDLGSAPLPGSTASFEVLCIEGHLVRHAR